MMLSENRYALFGIMPPIRKALYATYHVEKTGLFLGIVLKHAGKARRQGLCARLGDAAHRHAGVFGFHHHRDPAWLENGVDRTGHLAR